MINYPVVWDLLEHMYLYCREFIYSDVVISSFIPDFEVEVFPIEECNIVFQRNTYKQEISEYNNDYYYLMLTGVSAINKLPCRCLPKTFNIT